MATPWEVLCGDSDFVPKTAARALGVACAGRRAGYQAFFSRCHELLYWMNPLLSAESERTGAAFVIMEGDELQALKYQNNGTGKKKTAILYNPVAIKLKPKDRQGSSWSPHQVEHIVSENAVCTAEGSAAALWG